MLVFKVVMFNSNLKMSTYSNHINYEYLECF